jgi:hypothetical protein
MHRFTLVIAGSIAQATPVTNKVGTAFINFLERTGNACSTQHNIDEAGATLTRYISTELGLYTTRKILTDLSEMSLIQVITHYIKGSYTAGQAPSIAWYTAKNGKITH